MINFYSKLGRFPLSTGVMGQIHRRFLPFLVHVPLYTASSEHLKLLFVFNVLKIKSLPSLMR